MLLRFLGTGTSTGVPQLRCDCPVCRSTDERDHRLRASAIVQLQPGDPWILIDCSPDFRQQMLACDCPDLECLLVTHSHYDHVGGIDDMRPYCYSAPGGHFPVYCQADVADDLRSRVPYCFAKHLYPGVPTFAITEIEAYKPFKLTVGRHSVTVEPLRVMHAKLPILGYRMGPLAYITDCSLMPEQTLKAITGVDTLVVNALRHEEHMSHQNLLQALDVIKASQPRQAFLTHFSHGIGLQAEVEPTLPPNVAFAYDGLTVEII